jgi:hypothetical protein
MKKIILNTVVVISLFGFFYACTPDKPPQPTGDPRDKFVGNWSCNESSHLYGSHTFYVSITLDPSNSSQILMANFYQLGSGQKAYGIVANNYVNIPSQTVSGCSVRGSGNMNSSGNQISWNYYINDGADIDTCTAVYNK